MKFCENCGRSAEDNILVCDICGSPFDNQPNNENLINGTATKKKQINKKHVIIAVILVISIAVGTVAGVVINNKQKEMDRIQQNLMEYEDNLEEVYELMIFGGEKAEKYCSLKSKVWYNCICEEDSYETNIYTKDKYGRFYSDFNDALSSFALGERVKYDGICDNKKEVDKYIKDLKDYPEEFEDEYKAIKELYVAYSDMVDLAIGNSSYSYKSFSEALKNIKADFKSAKASAQTIV